MNMEDMSIEELKSLESQIKSEIASRQKSTDLVLYTHRCKDSANHHLRKYKRWAKLVTAVDTSKTNGYAFAGDFLRVEAEHKIPVGSIVIEVCDTKITAYQITPDGPVKFGSANTSSMSWLIEEIAQKL